MRIEGSLTTLDWIPEKYVLRLRAIQDVLARASTSGIEDSQPTFFFF